jgi:hypothetical protein
MCPSLPDILWAPPSKVMIKEDPELATDFTYITSEKKSCCTTGELQTRLYRL